MRMEVIGDVLFMRRDGGEVGEVVSNVERELEKNVEGYDKKRFERKKEEDVVRELVREISIEKIKIEYDGEKKKVVEKRI